jgi:hypothetical protein
MRLAPERAGRRAAKIVINQAPAATKLYDCTGDEITLDEVERISI